MSAKDDYSKAQDVLNSLRKEYQKITDPAKKVAAKAQLKEAKDEVNKLKEAYRKERGK